jgi:hypothetical protein
MVYAGAYAQELSTLEGKVIDADTKEPIPFASVYLAQTTFGMPSNSDGTFKLERIPSGKYDLIVSFVGYQSAKHSILFTGNVIKEFLVELKVQSSELAEVMITSKKLKNDKTYFSEFEKYFLGETSNAARCMILNREDIYTYRENGRLVAYGFQAIEIENRALGYKVIYDLKEFELNDLKHTINVSGIPRFIELVARDNKMAMRWKRERDRAYYGSVMHFFRSLKTNTVNKNLFRIKNDLGNALVGNDVIKEGVVKYNGSIYVTFTGELTEYFRGRQRTYQDSELQFNGIPITVFENGYYENYHNVILQGYMGWGTGIAELLPLEYQPSSSIK